MLSNRLGVTPVMLCVGNAGQSMLAIITLAAPHQQAPANVHAPLHAFYSGLQKAAAVGSSYGLKAGDETSRATVPLLSIAGGKMLSNTTLCTKACYLLS